MQTLAHITLAVGVIGLYAFTVLTMLIWFWNEPESARERGERHGLHLIQGDLG